jgi:hypothetical protein
MVLLFLVNIQWIRPGNSGLIWWTMLMETILECFLISLLLDYLCSTPLTIWDKMV